MMVRSERETSIPEINLVQSKSVILYREDAEKSTRKEILLTEQPETGYTDNSRRGVAQPGSAPASGAGGRKFESSRPDQRNQGVTVIPWPFFRVQIYSVAHPLPFLM
jgi:hypothetical protein